MGLPLAKSGWWVNSHKHWVSGWGSRQSLERLVTTSTPKTTKLLALIPLGRSRREIQRPWQSLSQPKSEDGAYTMAREVGADS